MTRVAYKRRAMKIRDWLEILSTNFQKPSLGNLQ